MQKLLAKLLPDQGPDNSVSLPGQLWIKADHDLPVAGSIKARGGIYEVLCFAESLALKQGLLASEQDNYQQLASPEARALFARYTLSVGSTGNLGLSIGLMAAALGFQACVHMSVEAKAWKKQRLRDRGVEVVEHANDYSKAVAAGREAAASDPFAYFVDDENSLPLFLGYSVAALRLKDQLQAEGIQVDAQHPLFVYLPCGVGGAPGGITFGLKTVFGDAVHCFFAEPTEAPCMYLGMAAGFEQGFTVYDMDLGIRTEADGLAVGQGSALVGQLMEQRLSGIYTVDDNRLFRDLYWLKQIEDIAIEPSAAAGFSGPEWLCHQPQGRRYCAQHQLTAKLPAATHLVWTTGGRFVPELEYRRFYLRGEERDSQIIFSPG